MQTKNRKRKLILKKWVRIVIVCILFFFASVSAYNIINGLSPKQNNFFEEEYLPKGKQYTSELIDYIDINFNYLYSGSKLTNIEYEYNING